MVACSPLLAMTLGAEMILVFPSVSARAKEASRNSAPNPDDDSLPRVRPILDIHPAGALVSKAPPHNLSPPVP